MSGRRTAGWRCLAVAMAAVGLAQAALAAPSDCGQSFAATGGAKPAGVATIDVLACDRDAASRHHCLGFDPAGARDVVLPARPAGLQARDYRLWLHLGTGVAGGRVDLALNGKALQPWWAPATPAYGWQLVTGTDKRAQSVRLQDGGTWLRLALPASVKVDCLLLAADPAFVPGVRAVHHVDRVWSGVGVLFDALADAKSLYLGYYNADRKLTVAAYDRATRVWQRHPLDSPFGGWDNHNAVALALDAQGNLHVAGNMHASPLVYARTEMPGRLDSLKLINRMVGRDEDSTTYPTWIALPDGRLGFLYREGVSGAGRDIVDAFDGKAWSRLGQAPLFAGATADATASAYPTAPTRGPDGFLHLAWVWRRTADAATSFQVAYAKSRDFEHWQMANGTPVKLPISPGGGDIVDDVPTGSGLSNQVTLGFDERGQPIVSYLHYDRAGNTQLYDARPMANGWEVVQVSDWHDRWELKGYGTIQALVRQGPVVERGGKLLQEVRHWKAGRFDYVLDPETLRPAGRQPAGRPLPAILYQPDETIADYGPIVLPARTEDGAPSKFVLRWEAQASNRDQRPDCTPAHPVACRPPPMPLLVYELP